MADPYNQLQSQQQQLAERQRQLESSRTLRLMDGIRGLLGRQKVSTQIQQGQSDINQRMQEFEQLQKQQELQQQQRNSRQSADDFLYRARKLASSKLPLSEIPKSDGLRDIVKAYREEGGLGTEQQKLIDLKFKPTYAVETPSKPSVYGPMLPEKSVTLTSVSAQEFRGSGPYGTIQRAGGQFTGPLTSKQIPRQIEQTNIMTGETKYFEEVLPTKPQSIVYASKPNELRQLGSDLKTLFQKNDLPTAIREGITRGSIIGLKATQNKLESGLTRFGIGADSLILRESGVSFKTAGDVALGLAFTPAFATGTAQQLESEYIYDYIAQKFIKKSEVSKVAQQRFAAALKESSEFRKLGISARGANVATEGELRRETARLINEAVAQGKLKQLQNFYIKAGREDLFLDVAAQEGFSGAARATIKKQIEAEALRDFPSSIKGASTITSYLGDEEYLKSPPKQQEQLSFSELNLTKQSNDGRVDFLGASSAAIQKASVLSVTAQASMTRQSQTSYLGQGQPQPQRSNQGLGLGIASQFFRQQSRQATRLNQPSELFRGRPEPLRPRGKPPAIPFAFDDDDARIKFKSFKRTQNFFRVEAKVKGKFRSLGLASSFGEAFKRGFGFVDTTLSRSFRIKDIRTNQFIPAFKSKGVRPSKRNRTIFVEPRRFALSAFGEKSQIKRARKNKNLFGI